MEVGKTHVSSISGEDGKQIADGITENMDHLETVILYFTIEHPEEEEIESFVEEVNNGLPGDTEVVGISVSGFMTDRTDYLMTQGALAVGLKDVEVEVNQLDGDVWRSSEDKIEEVMQKTISGEENLVFQSGPRQSESSEFWERIQNYSLKLLQVPRIRERMIDNIVAKFRKQKVGYTLEAHNVFNRLVREGEEFVGVYSIDSGSFTAGYETRNGELYSSEALINVSLPGENVSSRSVHPLTDENIEELEVVREFTDIEHYRNVIYRMDGRTIRDLKEELPIAQRKLDEGGFSYYAIVEDGSDRTAVTIGDIDVLGTAFELDDPDRVWIVRSSDLQSYKQTVQEEVRDLEGDLLPQLNIHVSKLNFFRSNTADLKDLVDEYFDEWMIVLGDIFRYDRRRNFMYPTIIEWRVEQ